MKSAHIYRYTDSEGEQHYFAALRQFKNGNWQGLMCSKLVGRYTVNKPVMRSLPADWSTRHFREIPAADAPGKLVQALAGHLAGALEREAE